MVAAGVRRRHEIVLPPGLEEQLRGRGAADPADGLDRLHGGQPRLRQPSTKRATVVLAAEVRDQPPVAHHEDIRLDPLLDAGQQASHGAAVAPADVGDPRGIHLLPGGEQVDSAAEVDDELDLVVAVFFREGDRAPAGRAGKRRVDGQPHGAGLSVANRPGQHPVPPSRHPVHEKDRREGALPFRAHEIGRDPPPFGAGVGEIPDHDAVPLLHGVLLEIEGSPGVVFEQLQRLAMLFVGQGRQGRRVGGAGLVEQQAGGDHQRPGQEDRLAMSSCHGLPIRPARPGVQGRRPGPRSPAAPADPPAPAPPPRPAPP